MMEPEHALALQKSPLGVIRRGHQFTFEVGVEGLFGSFAGANLETVVMGYAEDPAPGTLDVLPFFECRVEAQENFLHGFLCRGGMQPEGQEVAIHVLATFLEQLSHAVL